MARRVESHDAMRWPETVAFLRRLGIDIDGHRTLKLVIVLEKDCVAKVEHTVACADNGPSSPGAEFRGGILTDQGG